MTRTGTTPTITIDHGVAKAVAKDLRLCPKPFFFDGLASDTEYVLHEVAHGLSLGMQIRRYFDVSVGERLTAVQPLKADRRNEALALATEWIFYGYSDTPIPLYELRITARDQDVPISWLDRARATHRALVLTQQLGRWALEHKILPDNAASRRMFKDLRRRISETPRWPRSDR